MTGILHECQNYSGGGGGLGGSEKSPTPAPSVPLKIKIPVTVRRGISKRSHEKIGDCEQSITFGTLPESILDSIKA